MNILLLNPTIRSGEPIVRAERCQSKVISGIWPPIALAYLGAVLKAPQRQISLLDAVIEGMSFERMIENIIGRQPDLIVVQNTTPTLPDDLEMARLLKEKLQAAHISFFGLHATARPNDVLENSAVDTALIGEPELTAVALVSALEASDSSRLPSIAGLAYKDGSHIICNPRRPLIDDLDSLPFPDRDLLQNQRYRIPTTGKPFTLVKTSRGCPYECSFCTSSAFYGTRRRQRQPQAIYDEMVEVAHRYGITEIALHSETFNLEAEPVEKLCELIIHGTIRFHWMSNARADALTESVVRDMARSGCWLVTLGVESSNDEILRGCGKRATAAHARTAISLLKKYGIKVIAYFLLGLPGETRETAHQTLEFALETAPDYAHFYVVTPFPGTKLFDEAAQAGYLTSLDWSRYYHGVSDVLSYPWLTAEELTKLSKSFYRRFYLRPRRILREACEVRSLTDALGRATALRDLFRVWILNR